MALRFYTVRLHILNAACRRRRMPAITPFSSLKSKTSSSEAAAPSFIFSPAIAPSGRNWTDGALLQPQAVQHFLIGWPESGEVILRSNKNDIQIIATRPGKHHQPIMLGQRLAILLYGRVT